MGFPLTEEQRTAVENRGGALLVSAAAGSGKTKVLVERLLGRVEKERLDVDRFLVITYTRAAAAELRERIAAALSQRSAEEPGDRHLRRQLTLVYKTQISTIDALCSQLLRERGYLLDVDPDFRLCDESEGRLLLLQAVEDVLESRYEDVTEGSDFALLVDTMSAGRDDAKLVQIVLDVRTKVQSHPDPARWMARQEELLELRGVTDVGDTPWGALLLESAAAKVKFWRGEMLRALELCRGDKGMDVNYSPSVSGTLAGMEDFLRECGSWEGARSALPIPFPEVGRKRIPPADADEAEKAKAIRRRCKDRMDRLAAAMEDDSAVLLEDMRKVFPAVRGLFALVRDVEEAYRRLKERRRLLDFSDLEHLAVKLLTDGEGRRTETAQRWSERYEEIMVDEYQDVNEVQNTIISALSREEKNLFLVGDVKQSIYRFRLADPTIFLAKYRAFRPWEEAGEGEPRRVLLSTNFRSRGEVLGAANDVFRNIMSTELGELEYTDCEALYPPVVRPGEAEYATELDVVALTAAEEEEGPDKPDKDLLEARFIARRVEELVKSGMLVTEKDGEKRRLEYRDVAVLLRAPGGVLHQYARAFAERGIPWSAEGKRDFFGTTEIAVALSLLKIVDNPRQDVALLSVLRSPVYGFSPDRLSQLRALSPDTDFYGALEKGAQRGEEDCAAFLRELTELRFEALDRDSRQLLWQIYARTDLPGIFGGMERGEERRANLEALGELARRFEAAGHKGLFGFLTYLDRLRESGQDPLGSGVQGLGGVQILSIHRSKGLEFPVVILGGLTHRFNKKDLYRPILFHSELGVGPTYLDRERMLTYPTLARRAVAEKLEREMLSEEMRLLYVGMTRAKEKLILCCAVTGGEKGLRRMCAGAGSPVEPEILRESLSVGQWILLSALGRPEADLLRKAAGGEAQGSYESVWDIRLVSGEDLTRGVKPHAAATPQREESRAEAGGLEERFSWRYPWSEASLIPSKLTATALKGREMDEEAAQDAPRPKRTAPLGRPRFAAEEMGLTPAQKGTALHLVMQYIDFSRTGSREEIEEEIARLTREEFITPEQAQAVDAARIEAFFASPLGREMMAAKTLGREFKFSILVPAEDYYPGAGEGEQVLLQGVVDCWFETGEGITVVDFKTDRVREENLSQRAAEYRPQLAAYSRALSQVLGKPVKRRCLWFFALDRPAEG